MYIPWDNPKKFVTCAKSDSDQHESYQTWDGIPVKEIYSRYPNKFSIYDFLDKLSESDKKLYEKIFINRTIIEGMKWIKCFGEHLKTLVVSDFMYRKKNGCKRNTVGNII